MQFVNWIFELFRNTVHALIPSTYYGLVLIVAIVIVILAVLAIFGNRGRRKLQGQPE
ncbi:MAG TPA: hypothetical protein VE863_21095 [Pyrinomonadaceae bacterium]|nr:hypothetical protein [Pyrinomonadaceae bacterium]